ncbi:32830_t:CDS:1, partial [Racocetra persica]
EAIVFAIIKLVNITSIALELTNGSKLTTDTKSLLIYLPNYTASPNIAVSNQI